MLTTFAILAVLSGPALPTATTIVASPAAATDFSAARKARKKKGATGEHIGDAKKPRVKQHLGHK